MNPLALAPPSWQGSDATIHPLLPRYVPAVTAFSPFDGARAGSSGSSASSLDEIVGSLTPSLDWPHRLVTPSARQALLAHYLGVRQRLGKGVILLPVQVCPVVPALIRAAGHEPRALDGDGSLATPGPAGYAEALEEAGVVGILAAPMSGYVQGGWASLLPRLPPNLDVAVDLAQAPFSAAAFGPAFLHRADAMAFSFGVGKGFDTGGGLLLSRHAITTRGPVRNAGVEMAGTWLTSFTMRAVMGLHAYRAILPLVDKMAGSDILVRPVEEMSASAAARRWAKRLPIVAREFERAAERGAEVDEMPEVRSISFGLKTSSTETKPLRHILRLPGSHASLIIKRLRAAGLDCAPAGEPFPEGRHPSRWPAAYAFTQSSIRLPFLGRMSADQFGQAKVILREVLSS